MATQQKTSALDAGFGPQRSAESSAELRAAEERSPRREITYVVLPDATDPFLLARVRWPDVYQAISPVRPDWQDDPGLFDLPYAPSSTKVTYAQALEIATGWGARLPAADEERRIGPSLIRRMPSDWAKLSTAERRAWSIEIGKRRKAPASTPSAVPSAVKPPERQPLSESAASKRRIWSRRRVVIDLTATELTTVDLTTADSANSVIDLA